MVVTVVTVVTIVTIVTVPAMKLIQEKVSSCGRNGRNSCNNCNDCNGASDEAHPGKGELLLAGMSVGEGYQGGRLKWGVVVVTVGGWWVRVNVKM